jgi:hypothetical protein
MRGATGVASSVGRNEKRSRSSIVKPEAACVLSVSRVVRQPPKEAWPERGVEESLKSSQARIASDHVLVEPKLATRSQDTHGLVEHATRVGNTAQHPGEHHSVDRRVRQRYALGDPVEYPHGYRCTLGRLQRHSNSPRSRYVARRRSSKRAPASSACCPA